MYVGKVAPVKVPNEKSITIVGKGYVYYANTSSYDGEKKHSVDNRICIGKLVEGSKDMMFPNDKYFDLFPVASNYSEERSPKFGSVKIHNFRGLQNLYVENMRPVVLVSGKNNIGKTSLLEALFLLASHGNNASLQSLNIFRNKMFSFTNTEVWEPLFYKRDPSNTISITSVYKNQNVSLELSKDDEYIPNSNARISQQALEEIRLAVKDSYTIKGIFKQDDYVEMFHVSASGKAILHDNEAISGKVSDVEALKIRFISDAIIRSDASIADLMSRVELDDKKQDVVEILKMIDPTISDITTLSFGGVPSLYLRNKDGLLPIQFAGDGINKLIYIVLSILQSKDGAVLIDEVDTGFHYTMLDNLWRTIGSLSIKCNCQVICTTHSIEAISSSISGLRSMEGDFCYYRLGNDKDGLKAYRYSYDLLRSALNSDLEVR